MLLEVEVFVVATKCIRERLQRMMGEGIVVSIEQMFLEV